MTNLYKSFVANGQTWVYMQNPRTEVRLHGCQYLMSSQVRYWTWQILVLSEKAELHLNGVPSKSVINKISGRKSVTSKILSSKSLISTIFKAG